MTHHFHTAADQPSGGRPSHDAPADPIGNAVSFLTSAARMAAADHVAMAAKMRGKAADAADLAQATDVINAAAVLAESFLKSLDRIAVALTALADDLTPPPGVLTEATLDDVRPGGEPGPGLAGVR